MLEHNGVPAPSEPHLVGMARPMETAALLTGDVGSSTALRGRGRGCRRFCRFVFTTVSFGLKGGSVVLEGDRQGPESRR